MSGARATMLPFTVAALAAAATSPWWPAQLPEGLLLLLATLVLVLGVPHGGLDPLLASRVPGQPGLWHWLGFAAAYLLAVAAMVLLWWAWADAFLVLFLILSVQHFGADLPTADPLARRLLHGGSLVVLPALLHGETLASLFAFIAPGVAGPLVAVLSALSLPWLLCATGDALHQAWRGHATGLPRLALAAAALLAPPLLSFTLYFCLWHAPRHLRELRDRIQPWPRMATGISAACVAAVVLPAVVAWWRMPVADLPAFVVTTLFVGLGALTLPHMVLVARFQRGEAP